MYSTRKSEGRGLTSVLDVFVVRMISTTIHLENASPNNKYLNEVKRHERDRLFRVSSLLQESLGLAVKDEDAKTFSKKIRDKLKDNHDQRWTTLKENGSVRREQVEVEDRNKEHSES